MGDAEAGQAGADRLSSLTGRDLGRFRVGERLGGGVMAAVYQGEDLSLGRPVALKVLLPGADAVMRERFRREATTVHGLDHPHIVRTIEVGESAGLAYIAMELVDGSSLADLLERVGKLTVEDACRLLAPIAEALHHAHARGVVHRDVKPSNILLRRASDEEPDCVVTAVLGDPVVPLLSDFGIARALDAPELTSAGRTIGTPAFMAPEQCAGELDIDGRADVYALTAVFYRCLVGRPPYTGSTTQILHAHVYDPLLIPEEIAAALPEAATALLARGMMKDPQRRFPSAQVMAQALLVCAGSVEAEFGGDDSTVTMAVLPVARTPRPATSRVLVPAAAVIPRKEGTPTPKVAAPIPRVAAEPIRPKTTTADRAVRSERARLSLWLVAGGLAVGLLLLVSIVLSRLLPDDFLPDTVSEPTILSTPVVDVTPQAPETAIVAAPEPTLASSEPAAQPMPSPEAEPETPLPDQPPAVQVASAWENAQVFHEEEDWAAALNWLLLVRRVDEEFEAETVQAMLVDVYLRLAMEVTLRGGYEEALTYLEAALALAEEDVLLVTLTAATADMAVATDEDRPAARRALQEAYAQLAEASVTDDACRAEAQMNVALRILATDEVTTRLGEIRELCRARVDVLALSELRGRIIYSAEVDGAYRISVRAVGATGASALLVENAAQPRLSPNGRVLAFYSRLPATVGLAGLDLTAGLGPGARSIRFTEFAEDGRDAPPSWSPQGDRLVYGSTSFGDRRSRIYVVGTGGTQEGISLGLGKDPAWHPRQDLLVFNGVDDGGNQPGLWTMRSDGQGRARLTDNGNDQRPVWAPDGRTVVFMSNGRDGNWEVYRVDTVTGVVTRLTNHPSQDGLPAVSPDGRHVAFVSDRDGFWALWHVPLEGGETRRMGSISGQPISWLEHSLQWID